MGDGRLRVVVAHGGSTVSFFSLPRIHVVDTNYTIRNGSIKTTNERAG